MHLLDVDSDSSEVPLMSRRLKEKHDKGFSFD